MSIAGWSIALSSLASTGGEDAFGFGGRVGGASSGEMTAWALALMGLGAMLVAAVIVSVLRRDRARHGPTVRRLAQSLGISAHHRPLLYRVARAAGLASPGSLLISRGCFDTAVSRYAPRPGERERLRAIRQRVFQ